MILQPSETRPQRDPNQMVVVEAAKTIVLRT